MRSRLELVEPEKKRGDIGLLTRVARVQQRGGRVLSVTRQAYHPDPQPRLESPQGHRPSSCSFVAAPESAELHGVAFR